MYCIVNFLSILRDKVLNFFKIKSSEPVKYERVNLDILHNF